MRRSACQRCRAKKLKCDDSKPCLPCRKANVDCIARTLNSSTAARPLLPANSGGAPSSDSAVLEEVNILDLSKTLLDRGTGKPDSSFSSAIPGSHACNKSTELPFSWREHIPYALPDQAILDSLVRQYFISVNWFMHVIDLESFERMLTEQTPDVAPQSTFNFSLLMSLVWALGAHYLWTDPAAPYDRQFLVRFRDQAFQYVESRFLSLLSHPDLESVQVGILLGSFHLFNGLPNLGFGILGSTIKTAQLLGLHRGFPRSSGRGQNENVYTKVWWALEIFEKYAAIAFGRPCGIDGSDCDVQDIQDSKDGAEGIMYHQEKCRLYRIVGAFLGRRKEQKSPRTLHDIHTQLREWFANLPEVLKVENSNDPDLVQMQAVALQLAYDNIQIVLHRQAVFLPRPIDSSGTQTVASIEQLVESALRTSRAPTNKSILPICRSSHAAMHAAICLFTAGVVLSGLYLTHRVGQHDEELLAGLERIIIFFQNFPGQHYNLVAQSLEILPTLKSKCCSSHPDRSSLHGPASDVTRTDLVESILESTGWTFDNVSSFTDFNDFTTTDLLDYASGSSLQGIAQAWLWSELESGPAINHE